MSERAVSFFLLSGSALVFLVVWFLSIVVVRRDLRRRNTREIERRAWTIAAVGLPLFGSAMYLFVQVLRGYFSPVEPAREAAHEAAARDLEQEAAVEPAAPDLPFVEIEDALRLPENPTPVYAPVPANGKAVPGAPEVEQTPSTVPVVYQPLAGNYGLYAAQGPHAGEFFQLSPLPRRIGRGPDAAIALDADLNVSRTHAEIYEWMGQLRVRDLGSVHGTLVNGVPVTDQSILPGDRISVGGSMLIVREQA